MQATARLSFPVLEDARDDEFVSICHHAVATLPPEEIADLLTGLMEIAARFRH